MILITGATGQLGYATIESLISKGIPANEIAALVRDEKKASNLINLGIEIRIGHYNDYNSLINASRGIERLLLISSSEMVDRLIQHKNVINAAKENDVKHIIYTGIDIKSFERTAIPHVSQIHKDTADYLKGTGMTYTLLNNTLYADLIALFSGDNVLESGIFFPAGTGKNPFVSRKEMGEAAAVVLTTTGHENKEYAITANTAHSFSEIAEILSDIAGKEVKYLQPDVDTYIKELTKAGIPKESASFLAGFGTAIGQNEFDTDRSDLEILLGRKPMELREFLSSIYGK
ncbi:SDR family oxidoreductase [Flavobacterium pectinovorum]|uniref:SDR family oxidoreductase n=1 Tax=Flavobacterium pectinovorum TaxID=29533 RepID=UPI00265E20F8|nr:SDR family oxidoreductase [Flavobacterium pectinovorum]WKL49591.1 SDR family oxidoreductase [Flavobacterium pectinovorum]